MAHIGNWEWDIATDKAYWSEEMYRIFGRDPQKLAPSLKEYYDYIHPDDLDYYCKVNDYKRKVCTSGLDFRIVLANGEERTLHIKSDFILNDENNPIQVKGIVQDITERKRVEEKLRESEEKYRNIVETANELILITDNENVITYVNQRIADMVGYLRKKLLADQFGVSSVKNIDLLSKGIWKIGGRE
jgi:PAS domain S-box-containing protein